MTSRNTCSIKAKIFHYLSFVRAISSAKNCPREAIKISEPIFLLRFVQMQKLFPGSDLVGGDCVTLHEQYDQFLSLMGVPAVACVVACTVLLLVLIRQKSQSSVNSSHDAQSQRPVSYITVKVA